MPQLSGNEPLFTPRQKEKIWYWIRWMAPLANTITSIVIATANGLKGTVTTAPIPPVGDEDTPLEATIELGTDVTGILQGDGDAISALAIGSGLTYSGGTLSTNLTAVSPLTYSAGTISTSMATNRLVGRSTASTGVMEQLSVGNYLSLSTGTLSGTGEVNVIDAAGDTTTWIPLIGTQTGKQTLLSDDGITYNATTGHITSKMILNAGGTVAGSAGIYIPSGSLLSTIEAGAIENDGYQIYATQTDGTNGFGREIIYKWSQNNTASVSSITTTPTDIYDAPVRLYNNAGAGFTNEVELDIGYTHSGTRGTVTFTFTASAAPTSSAWWIRCSHTDPLGAASLTSGSTATMQNLEYSRDIRASGASVTVMKADITLTAAGTGSVSYRAKFNMMFATQASATITTLNPQISTSAGTISVSGITSAKSRIRGESI